MKNLFLKIGLAGAFLGLATISVSAQSECPWLPEVLCNLVANDNPTGVIEARVRAAMFIAIGAIILVAVAYGLYNAYKYIRSGGGDEMGEANQGMRAILFGIGSIFVILLGIAAVLIFFGANFLEVFLAPTCINAPDGAGCYACQNQEAGTNADVCQTCNANTQATDITISSNTQSQLLIDVNNNGNIDEGELTAPVDSYTATCETIVREVRQ